jgi:TPR repeat protein
MSYRQAVEYIRRTYLQFSSQVIDVTLPEGPFVKERLRVLVKLQCPEALYLQSKACADDERAHKLLREAAERGFVNAQHDLGLHMYQTARRSSTATLDPTPGLKWLKQAAKRGNPRSHLVLGLHYLYNLRSDGASARERVLSHLKAAAQKGYTDAFLLLGILHGRSVYGRRADIPRDDVEALKWYNLALERGDHRARLLAAKLEVWWDYDQLNEAELRARSWRQRHALPSVPSPVLAIAEKAVAGDAPSQYALGKWYKESEGLMQNQAETIRWFTKAANQRLLSAQLTLGLIATDQDERVKWLKAASAQGHVLARTELIRDYRREAWKPDADEGKQLFHWVQLFAEQGDRRMQFFLAELYLNGQVIPSDHTAAYKWLCVAKATKGNKTEDEPDVFQNIKMSMRQRFDLSADERAKAERDARTRLQYPPDTPRLAQLKRIKGAAKRGDVKACYTLGLAYHQAYDETRAADVLGEAVYWLLAAATEGHADAQVLLGSLILCDEEGVVEATEETAAAWLWEAAAQGSVEACGWLGQLYAYGVVLAPDDGHALELLLYALAIQDRPVPQALKAVRPATREYLWLDAAETLRERMSAAEVAEAYHRAEMRVQASGQMNAGEQEALVQLQADADAGDTDAHAELGYRYFNGLGVPPDRRRAAVHFQEAAEAGDARAQEYLALLLMNGGGSLSKDWTKAHRWLRAAAAQGLTTCQYNLAFTYLRGDGTEKNIDEGIMWLRRAAEQGDPMALYELANLYNEGRHLERDPIEAVKHYTLATAMGDRDAMLMAAGLPMDLSEEDRDEALARARRWFSEHLSDFRLCAP